MLGVMRTRFGEGCAGPSGGETAGCGVPAAPSLQSKKPFVRRLDARHLIGCLAGRVRGPQLQASWKRRFVERDAGGRARILEDALVQVADRRFQRDRGLESLILA
jgi:hypothetical protein